MLYLAPEYHLVVLLVEYMCIHKGMGEYNIIVTIEAELHLR